MSEESEVRIPIVSTADTSGIDRTSRALKGTEAAGKESTVSLREAREGFRDMNAASEAASGNIMGIARALSHTLPHFEALRNALPAVGMAGAAIAAWTTFFEELEKIHEAHQKLIEDLSNENFAEHLKSITEAYKKMGEEISITALKADGLLKVQEATNEASKKQELLQVRAQEVAALANVTDPLQKRTISAGFEIQRAQIESAYGSKAEDIKTARLSNEVLQQEADARRYQEQIADYRAAVVKGEQQTVSLNRASQDNVDWFGRLIPGVQERELDFNKKERDDNAANLKNAGEKLVTAAAELAKLSASLDTNRSLLALRPKEAHNESTAASMEIDERTEAANRAAAALQKRAAEREVSATERAQSTNLSALEEQSRAAEAAVHADTAALHGFEHNPEVEQAYAQRNFPGAADREDHLRTLYQQLVAKQAEDSAHMQQLVALVKEQRQEQERSRGMLVSIRTDQGAD